MFVVPQASWEEDVVWGCDILAHLLPCMFLFFFCVLCSSCPESRVVRLVFFHFGEEIVNGPHACV